MKNYEGSLLQEFFTVPLRYVWYILFLWIGIIAGLIYWAYVI